MASLAPSHTVERLAAHLGSNAEREGLLGRVGRLTGLQDAQIDRRGCKSFCVTAHFKHEELTAPQTQS